MLCHCSAFLVCDFFFVIIFFFVALSAEEERLWSIVRTNSLDFNAWTALIEETEKTWEVCGVDFPMLKFLDFVDFVNLNAAICFIVLTLFGWGSIYASR